jgi:hypothetical protein
METEYAHYLFEHDRYDEQGDAFGGVLGVLEELCRAPDDRRQRFYEAVTNVPDGEPIAWEDLWEDFALPTEDAPTGV